MGKQEQQLLEQVLRRIGGDKHKVANVVASVIASARIPEKDRAGLQSRIEHIARDALKKLSEKSAKP